MSDRLNPKVPAVIGIVLLAFSLYLNSFLSLYSEHAQIMMSLYVRGFALGLVFTPLSTIALSGISRDRMAQASGLFNVIRQVGGSFGVALIGTMLTRRVIFHSSMYGQAVDRYSPAFARMLAAVQHQAVTVVGGTMAEGAARARAVFGAYIGRQAFVEAINDDFLIAAGITILGVVPILALRTRRKKRAVPPAMD
jgi:DHA2 family multidrug resistance protein